ncbi:2-C-methyl-D-erythritol 2,4-cyclodiphosphate synthase [soil metagenome]
MTVTRSGIGYDVHAFAPDRPLMLGGIEIPYDLGLDGHSDADVLLHAVTDALLGAAALGDIGTHFPPSDPAYRNASSQTFLSTARSMLTAAGFIINNIDCTVIAEAPKILPYCLAIRELIATALDVTIEQVSVKATTNERLGFIGRQEGIAALAIASVSQFERAASS